MFRPFYNGHLQAPIPGGAVNAVIVYEHNRNVLLEYKDPQFQNVTHKTTDW
jgi:hypothetical protein